MNQSFRLSLFQNKRDNKPQLVTRSWQQLCANFQKPQVRLEKDGLLFSPAHFEPALRRKENVKELSLLVLDVDHSAELETLKERLAALPCAFSIYSTHSHLRQTESNPEAEPRFRVVVPLAEPVQSDLFPALWQHVKQATGLPLDEAAKDASRIFYTPAIPEKGAPFCSYVQDGTFLDWRALLASNDQGVSGQGAHQTNGSEAGYAAETSHFNNHDERHIELCRRIEQRAKQNSRGAFEMKCPAHKGFGDTSLVYFPDSQSVKCLQGCDYFSILRAFGLPDKRLPKHPNTKAEKIEDKPLAVIKASSVAPKKVDWLWYPYIPLNYVTLFSGEEGVGKSWIFCAVASGLSNGFLPLGERFDPKNVLIFSAEDAAEDALVPRLIKCGANLERVSIVNERFTFDEKGLLRFEHYIAETNPAWVIIDPLFAYSDLRFDLNKPHHARHVAGSFERVAKKFGIAISYLIHFNKSKGGGDARQAVSSSQEFSNAARSIVLIGKDPQDETRRALIHKKHNYSPKGKAIGYQIIGNAEDVNFYWLGESTLTEREIVDRAGSAEEHAEKSEAVAFLREALRDGRRSAGEIEREAEGLGISKQRLRTARGKLVVETKPEGFGKDKKWFWELPKARGLDVNNDCLDVGKNGNQHLSATCSDKTSCGNGLRLDVDAAKNQHLRANVSHAGASTRGVLFDASPETPNDQQKRAAMPLVYNYPCWVCGASVSNQDSRCPNCEQDLNDLPF